MSSRIDTFGITDGFAVTPSDTVDLQKPSRGVYVGVSGDVRVTLLDQAITDSVTFVGLAAGVLHPIQCKRIWSTSTTATGIVVGH